MSLFTGLPYKDRLGNDIYPDFRNMIRMEDVAKDQQYSEAERAIGVLQLLYGSNIPDDIEAAYGELLWFYFRGEIPEKPKGKIVKFYDFTEDGPYMAGSFLDAYNLDLTDLDVHIHWWKFMPLFIALPDGTSMMKRMCDRNIDTSKMKGETKRYYEERKKAVAFKSAKVQKSATPEERRIAKQRNLDSLYAEAERRLKEQGALISEP